MLSIAVIFSGLVGIVLSLDATVVFHCDNEHTASVSNNDGDSFTVANVGSHWPTAFDFTVNDVTCDTIIEIDCADKGGIGGFIANVNYDSKDYYTDNPISNSIWQVVSSTDNVLSPLVYHVKTSSPWTISTPAINSNADWVWNEKTWNTMKFRFEFCDILCPADMVGTTCTVNSDCPDCMMCCDKKVCHYKV